MVMLEAANPAYEPIELPAEQVTVQGQPGGGLASGLKLAAVSSSVIRAAHAHVHPGP